MVNILVSHSLFHISSLDLYFFYLEFLYSTGVQTLKMQRQVTKPYTLIMTSSDGSQYLYVLFCHLLFLFSLMTHNFVVSQDELGSLI